MKLCLIFDLDGTLFRTEAVAVPAFRQTFEHLMKKGIYQGEQLTDHQITGVFGMTTAEIWDKLLPDATDEEKAIADEILEREELSLLSQGVGELFPGVRETLGYLREKGVRMYIASNGGEPYVLGVVRATKLGTYFEGIYTAGKYKTSKKEELVNIIVSRHPDKRFVMVGDRQSDVSAGKENGLFVIGCDFGFARNGELDEADLVIENFSDIGAWYDIEFTKQPNYNDYKGQK